MDNRARGRLRVRLGLRGRLVLGSIIAVPAVTLALTLIAQSVMVSNLRGTMDGNLQDRWEVAATAVRNHPYTPSDGYMAAVREVYENHYPSVPPLLRISDTSGEQSTTLGNIPKSSIHLLDSQLSKPTIAQGDFYNLKVKGVEALRVYTQAVLDPDTGERLATIQVADSLGPLNAAEGALWKAAVSIGIGGSLFAFIVGTFVVYRGLAPLDRILQRIKQVNSRDLAEGLLDEPRPPELQELAVSLNTMWDRLDAAFKSQRMLIAGLSHDLRTPLAIIEGQVDVLLMQPSLLPEDRQSLERMSKELGRLIRMTNNLLLNAQLEAEPSITFRDVNLQELLEEVVSDACILTDDQDMELDAPRKISVRGDYDLLKQMTINLVDNAIKYTPRGGRIAVGLRDEANAVVLRVSDTGPGIPAEHLLRIMEPFYRADPSRNTRAGGAGLGLAIVKRISDLHHGAVSIMSTPGHGTLVEVRLPVGV